MKISKLNLTDFSESNVSKQAEPVQDISDKEFVPFGKEEEEEEQPEYTKTQLDQKVEEAYRKGLEEGKSAGVQETQQTVLTVEQNVEQSVQKVLEALTTALSQFEEEKKSYQNDLGKIAHHTIKKILDKKIEENFEDIIISSFEKMFPAIIKEPNISIKMNPASLEKVKSKMEKIISKNKFKGDIEFVADESLSGDVCQVEWERSGINFDLKEKIKEIDEIINEYIKSM